ncbi:MAG: rod shape-determining protein MreC [Candidatus Omnitrophica bacterium]|nr:rod shape-determining protein MreC [Candidatus Omnitrophota bacterium]
MRLPARAGVIVGSVLLLSATASALHQPLRIHHTAQHVALAILRFPFTVVSAAVSTARLLPRLPSLAQENAALRAQLAQQQSELADWQQRQQHAKRLSALAAASAATGVVADVIGRSTIPTQQIILLNRGRADGVSPDHVVVDAAGVVGRVRELTSATALVTLLTDPESRIAALVERSREAALLVGRGRGRCELLYLDAEAEIQVGDRVITAGLGGAFPKGLRLGEVTRVTKHPAAGTTSAWVAPSARVGQLEEVLCLPPQQ